MTEQNKGRQDFFGGINYILRLLTVFSVFRKDNILGEISRQDLQSSQK